MTHSTTLLAAPDGKWVFPDSEEFLTLFGDGEPDYDAVAYAVKNLGFIELQTIGTSTVKIRFHPRNVEPPAIQAARKILFESTARNFVVEYLDEEWQSETLPSGADAAVRINELQTLFKSGERAQLSRPLPKPTNE